MKNINSLFDFIERSPTSYHAVAELQRMLEENGFERLYEGEDWKLDGGKGYYTVRNGSSIIAFRHRAELHGFMICASHSDSPSFKVKMTAETVGAYSRLEVEKYGGMIYYSWLDRPLSAAGRAVVKTDSGLESRLVNIDSDILTVPSLAIHLNRNVNDGVKLNPAQDLLPLYSLSKDKGSLISSISESLGVGAEDIVSHDLFVYNRERGRVIGKNGEFMLCPRLDDLACVYASAVGFLSAEDSGSTPVLAVFDNEEVGSETKQGAASTFLVDTLIKIANGHEAYTKAAANSFMVSADNAHALHPAHPELSDPDHAPMLGGGIVVKYNANQRYATDGISDAVFRTVAERAGVKVQSYCNRADLPGGSTLGSISDTRVSVPTVDIGLPQLAMHSANETAAVSDFGDMIKALREFYSSSLSVLGERISL